MIVIRPPTTEERLNLHSIALIHYFMQYDDKIRLLTDVLSKMSMQDLMTHTVHDVSQKFELPKSIVLDLYVRRFAQFYREYEFIYDRYVTDKYSFIGYNHNLYKEKAAWAYMVFSTIIEKLALPRSRYIFKYYNGIAYDYAEFRIHYKRPDCIIRTYF